jgi:hypothetical protein
MTRYAAILIVLTTVITLNENAAQGQIPLTAG